MNKKIILLSILIFLLCNSVISQEIPDPMIPPRMVNDFSGLLNPADAEKLEIKLQSFYNETSTQIYIVILDDLQGYDISDFSFRLGEKWGVGTEGKNNGIVITLNPSPDRLRGKSFIAIGYGLESVVPDAVTNRIVDLEMVPYFKEQKFYEGLDVATTKLIELTKGEYTAEKYLATGESDPFLEILIPLIILIIISSFFGSRKSKHYTSGSKNLPFWMALFLLSGSKNSHKGSFKDFKTGSGSFGGFGGFGGGGFGGGGGGHFGGGGAGGSW